MLFDHISSQQPAIRSLAFVGVAKHAGKTTALQCALTQAFHMRLRVGLMSIGVDGESYDAIIGLPKPELYVVEGTLVATAKQFIHEGSAGLRIVAETGISSPFGPVFINEVERSGTVVLAGIRQLDHVKLVQTAMRQGRNVPDLYCIDGAFDRSVSAHPDVCDGVVLATGAVVAPTLQGVVQRTKERVRKLLTPIADSVKLAQAMERSAFMHTAIAVLADDSMVDLEQSSTFSSTLRLPEGTQGLCLPGAVTDRFVEQVIATRADALMICATDPTKIFVSENLWNRLERVGHRLLVQKRPKLVAITVNPTDIRGRCLQSSELIRQLKPYAKEIPIIDVMEHASVQGEQA